MKSKTLLATVLITVVAFSSCKKEDLTSVALSTSSTDDDYVETGLPVQTPVTYNVDANIGGYLEALPAHYADHPDKHYPLIIFLHGSGETGSGSTSDLGKVAVNAIPRLIANNSLPGNFVVNGKNYQFVVISPQFKGWPQPSDIEDIINYASTKYRINGARIYMCGLSMGGGGAWDYAWNNNGSRLSAVVPISGASWPTTQKGQYIAADSLAVWAFHNNDDGTVPSWYSIDYVQYINTYNPAIPAKLTLWPTGGHDAWTKATDPNYRENGQNIYEWMLSFSKPKLRTY